MTKLLPNAPLVGLNRGWLDHFYCTKPIGSAASVVAPPAVAPVRDGFLSIRSTISRSVRRSDSGNFERAMHPMHRGGVASSEVQIVVAGM